MKPISTAVFLLLLLTSLPVLAENSGIGGVVSGEVQKVGFRAFILHQAIAQNLGGWTVNMADGRVSFVLYGEPEGIAKALEKIQEGPDRSDVSGVKTWSIYPQPKLPTFTVYAWTSETRNLHVPRDLVFQKRANDSRLDKDESKKVYHQILHSAGVE